MIKNFSLSDKLIFGSAIISLIYAEIAFFMGEREIAYFVGLWVPSILAFGIYLNILKSKKNG